MAGARVRDITLSAAVFGGGVSLDLPLHKTAQGGQKELTRRSLRCVCTAAIHPLCPACAARRHLPRLNFGAARGPDSALFPTTTTELRTKAASVEMFGRWRRTTPHPTAGPFRSSGGTRRGWRAPHSWRREASRWQSFRCWVGGRARRWNATPRRPL